MELNWKTDGEWIKAETKTHKYSIRKTGACVVQMFVKPGAGGVECWTVWESKIRCQSHHDSMTKALRELHATVKAGMASYRDFSECLKSILPDTEHVHWPAVARSSYNGDLNAARALHDALLPDAPVKIVDQVDNWRVTVNWPHMEWQPTFTALGPFAHSATDDDPARAWLLAILQYLIAGAV